MYQNTYQIGNIQYTFHIRTKIRTKIRTFFNTYQIRTLHLADGKPVHRLSELAYLCMHPQVRFSAALPLSPASQSSQPLASMLSGPTPPIPAQHPPAVGAPKTPSRSQVKPPPIAPTRSPSYRYQGRRARGGRESSHLPPALPSSTWHCV